MMPKRKIVHRAELRQLPSVPMRELDRKFIKQIQELKESNEELKHSNEILQKKVDRLEMWILTNFGKMESNEYNNSNDEESDNGYGIDNMTPNPPSLSDETRMSGNSGTIMEEDFEACGIKESQETKTESIIYPKLRSKRTELNLEDKISVIRLTEEGKMSQRKIAKDFNVGKTQIGNILRSKVEIREAYATYLKDRINMGPGVPIPSRIERKDKNGEVRHHHLVNRQVKQFYEERLSRDVYTTGPQLQIKARELAAEYGVTKFTAISGWLHNFCRKYRVKLGMKNQFLEKPNPTNVELPIVKVENFEIINTLPIPMKYEDVS